MSQTMTAQGLTSIVDDLLATHPPAATDPRTFLGARFDAGLAWVWVGRDGGGRGRPGPEGSVLKLTGTEHSRRAAAYLLDLLGNGGALVPEYRMTRPALPLGGDGPRDAAQTFLRSRANTIEGGTSQILRNILGERVLGLPGDVGVDKGVPWRDVPR
ncbi:acyl-CoA dehydrogenase family protein [Parafrankia sp. EUN1f]|uniref:acyl-CoA dehydrogenase family protein n=1 Tax=Parafrankia sp. EUN1f TaxID=102897 RepID=UPI0001C43EC7|nr:acyl-CoA dehydrogenase family protein [Parafrankia sp. EUN1f]EFC84242.1 acyl-CoA dehydrogenase domain protein [Parafrankia sp. EUN1f]